jgi:glycosyltransferase involved in cell wall biosynthesis
MSLPNISILVPTYNRSKFLPLLIHNLKTQTYPHKKLEVCIYDDGTEPITDNIAGLQLDIYPIKLVYHRDKVKKTIGEKRNYLVKKLSRNKFLCFMDDDDIYSPIYVEYSFKCLKENKAGLVGSSSMLFTYPEKDYVLTGIKCPKKYQIHEATMLFTRRYFGSMGGFEKSSQGEGVKFIQDRDRDVFNTDINNVMVCVAHDGNTIDKEQFNKEELKLGVYNGPEIDILNKILCIK